MVFINMNAVEDASENRHSSHKVDKTGFGVGSDLVMHAFGKISSHIMNDGITGVFIEQTECAQSIPRIFPIQRLNPSALPFL